MLHSIAIYCTILYYIVLNAVVCSIILDYTLLFCITLHHTVYRSIFSIELCSLILNYCITFILFFSYSFQTCLCRYFYDPYIFTQLWLNCAAAPVLDDDAYNFSLVKNAAIDRESWREIRSNCKLMKFVNLQLSSPGNLFKAGAFLGWIWGSLDYSPPPEDLQGTHVSLQLNFYTLKQWLFVAEDCGSTDPPAVSVLGGWAKQNTLGIVAASSRTGRVFCHSRAVNGSMPFQVTAEQVQEAPWHDMQEEMFATRYSHDSVQDLQSARYF